MVSEKFEGTVSDSYRIDGPLTVYEVSAFRRELLDYVNAREGVLLDLEGITDCDTAGVQLLFAATRAVVESGKKINVSHIPETVQQAAARIGLDAESFLSNA